MPSGTLGLCLSLRDTFQGLNPTLQTWDWGKYMPDPPGGLENLIEKWQREERERGERGGGGGIEWSEEEERFVGKGGKGRKEEGMRKKWRRKHKTREREQERNVRRER
jgi:hypothetical protein